MLKILKDPVTGEEVAINIYTDGKGVGVEILDPKRFAKRADFRRADVYIGFDNSKLEVIVSPTPEIVMGEGEPTVIEVTDLKEER